MGEAPAIAKVAGSEATQLAAAAAAPPKYANVEVRCETYWTAVADSQLVSKEPPTQLTRHYNNDGRGEREKTRGTMFAGLGGILRPSDHAHKQELLYRLGVLIELGNGLKPPLLTESAEVTVAGLASWLKGWCPCSSTRKAGVVPKAIAPAAAAAAAAAAVQTQVSRR